MELNVIEMFVDEQDEEQGIDAVSIVSDPAIESFPVFLSSSKEHKLNKIKIQDRIDLSSANDEQQVLMGALLIPDKKIFRRDEKTGKEYYIKFSKETCRKILRMMMKRGKMSNTTEEHKINLDGNIIEEAWIKKDMKKDQSALHGNDAPVGSIMISMYIEDKNKYREYKKNGMAFSLEGYFTDNLKMKKQDNDVIEQIKEILSKI